MEQPYPSDTVSTRFARLTDGDFPQAIDQLWAVASEIKDVVKKHQQQGNISATEGLNVVAGCCGSLFGWNPQQQPEPAGSLISGLLSQTQTAREREYAGSRS